MQSLTLLVPEHFVTIEDTIPMISNVISIRDAILGKTNQIQSTIARDDSQN
jgi:hypothetical protein